MRSTTTGHGRHTEDAVQTFTHRLFGCDLVLRSPQLIEQSGIKELTDFLVIVDDTAIVVQSKSLAIDISDLSPTKFGRIQKKQEEAKRQFSTTLNAHIRGARVCASNPLDVTFDIDWTWIKKRIGVVTLHVADELYGDPGFRFQYPYPVEEYKGIVVHTILVNDLAQMTSELSTPADVLNYLEAREKCVMSGRFVIGNELDFLGFFKAEYPEIERALSDPTYIVGVVPGYWERYRNAQKDRISDRDNRFGSSAIVERFIRALQSSVDFSAAHYGLTPQESALNYLKLIGMFGKLTRIERTKIGDMLMVKREKTKSSKWGYFMHISQPALTAYLFLLTNEPDREKRKNFLKFLCVQACHAVDCVKIVGIVTEGAQLGDFSMDALIWDGAEIRSETEPEKGFQVFKQPVQETVTEWDS